MKRNIIITMIILFAQSIIAYPQQGSFIPSDPDVKVGKLENGLTYYIRHNELPKERAEFYIAQKVGSILEEEEQRGLAHFLEHMCFNGTKNFPGNSLVDELESKGVKFGVNLNAYTSIDETVYNLSNVPITREGLIDTALLVLHDWSGFVLLNDQDIDNERGVIHEEWRTRNNANARAMEQTLKNIFPGSRYAERMPIGLIDVIDNFPYQAIRDYYKKWYRPDLQAIIVVGDIDVDEIETKIKKLFSDIPVATDPAPREKFSVPDNSEPIVSIVTDPEIQRTEMSVFYKKDVIPDEVKNTVAYYSNMIVESLITSMFNQRMYEISQKPDPPFSGAAGGIGNFAVSKTKRAWVVQASPRNNNDWEKALRSILLENYRVKQHGFTKPELERAKTNMLRSFEVAYNERSKIENGKYVKDYVQNFLNNQPYPNIEWEYDFAKSELPGLSLEVVNKMASSLASGSNVVFTFTGPQNDDVVTPTQAEILNVWEEVKNTETDSYFEEEAEGQLIDKKPAKGKVVEITEQPFGYTQWLLSNGVKILFKKTDFKKDQVIMSGYSPGGISLIEENDLPSAVAINSLATIGGVGSLNRVDLNKALTGKVVRISPSVNGLSEGISGSASPKDFETLLQLTYLFFTQPRIDQDAFETWKTNTREVLKNATLNPMSSFNDTVNKIMACNHPRKIKFDLDVLEKVDYNKAISLYKERFSNAGDFTFFITGNIDADSIKDDIETYLGGLPSAKQKEKFIDWEINPPEGIVKNHFSRPLETPKSSIISIYTGSLSYSLENIVLMNYLKSILDIIYTENIREKEGGAYGISVKGNLNNMPKESFSFQVQFDTDPSKRDKLLSIVYDEIEKITKQDPDMENIDKVKKFMLKGYQEQLIQNVYWQQAISLFSINGIDVHSEYEKVVESITPSMVREFASKVFSQGNIVEVSMNPEE